MSVQRMPGREAQRIHGVLTANAWLLARRVTQLAIFLSFAAGPWFGIWLVKGTLSSSLTLDILPLTDPLILAQGLLAGHTPEAAAVIGAAIVTGIYFVIGGRLYCSWVCPINPVSDLAAWARRRLGIQTDWKVRPDARLWVLGGILIAAAATHAIAFELINPITTLYRGLLFGLSAGLVTVLLVFLLDLFIGKHAWCGHICPVGAFYGLINHTAMLRVSAHRRDLCDDCMDCYAVCPEVHVISPALKGARTDAGPVITAADCTACGRCIDVCPERVFRFTHRFDQTCSNLAPGSEAEQHKEAA